MKLAMWTSWETRCGIAAYTRALVDELCSQCVEVDVVPVPYTSRDPAVHAATLKRLNAADLVHIQHEYTFFGGIIPRSSSLPLFYRRLERPRVVTAHTVFDAGELLRLAHERRPRQRLAKRLLSLYPPYRTYVERQPFAGAAAVIVHTEEARARMARRDIPPGTVHVLPAGMPPAYDAPEVPERAAEMRRRCDLEGGKVVTVFGYVTPSKGYEVALEALASLPPAVKLLIAGGTRAEHEAPYLEELQEKIRGKGLERRVAITGYLEEPDLAAAMSLSDLVLVPHTEANGSYSVMIALSYGKPVLASDLACFREIHDANHCLELFPSGDERALAERTGFLLASSSARSALSERARAFAREQSWSAVAQRTRSVYDQALRATAGRGGNESRMHTDGTDRHG